MSNIKIYDLSLFFFEKTGLNYFLIIIKTFNDRKIRLNETSLKIFLFGLLNDQLNES